MNTMKKEVINESMKTLTFECNGHELVFGYEQDSEVVFVWEQRKFGNDILAKPSNLPSKWLKEFTTTTSKFLKDDGVCLFRTPLGDQFELSKKDLKEINNFLNEQTKGL